MKSFGGTVCWGFFVCWVGFVVVDDDDVVVVVLVVAAEEEEDKFSIRLEISASLNINSMK